MTHGVWLERRFSQSITPILVERHVYTGAQVDDDVAIAKRPHRPVAEKNTSSSRRPPVRRGKQKNNTDQALSGRRITRPSLSQATELELNLLNNVHQISSNQSSLPITVTRSEICVYASMFVNIE